MPPQAAVVAGAALLLLAGCGAPAPPVQDARPDLAFKAYPQGNLEGNLIVWSMVVANSGNSSAAAARLHLDIQFSGDASHDLRDADIPALAPHGEHQVTLQTYYKGYGDYTGLAQVQRGSLLVARGFAFFERCAPVLAC